MNGGFGKYFITYLGSMVVVPMSARWSPRGGAPGLVVGVSDDGDSGDDDANKKTFKTCSVEGLCYCN